MSDAEKSAIICNDGYMSDDLGRFTKMSSNLPYEIRTASRDDWEPAMGLAWKTFLKFEAGDYTPEGIRSFQDFLTDNGLFRMYAEGKYPLFVAFDGEQLIGMITLRNENHISLLFVDERYHRQGVGRTLLNYAFRYVSTQLGKKRVTVFAAPYGCEFYHKLGFRDLGPQMHKDGIFYTPMEYFIA